MDFSVIHDNPGYLLWGTAGRTAGRRGADGDRLTLGGAATLAWRWLSRGVAAALALALSRAIPPPSSGPISCCRWCLASRSRKSPPWCVRWR